MPASSTTFSLEGVAELLANFRQLEDSLRSEILSAACMSGALVVLADAQNRVPVRTGTLKRSLHAEFGESTPTKATVDVGTDIFYAPFLEYGTSRMAARPYLRPALDQNQEKVKAEIASTARELIRDEAQTIAARRASARLRRQT